MRRKILLIDDEEWNISKLKETLHRYGGETHYASALDDALAMLREGRWGAVVTDFHMESLDGKQIIAMLRGRFGGDMASQMDLEEISAYDPDLAAVIRQNFETFEDYRLFVQSMATAAYVLFSAQSYGDCSPDGLEGVFVEQKNNRDPNDYRAERNIASYLMDAGVLSPSHL